MDSTPEVEIKLAEDSHIVGIVYVQATSWIKHYPSKDQGISEDDIRSVDFRAKLTEWQHILRSPNYQVWVAVERKNVLAFLAARKDADTAEVHEQHTLPDHARKGLGSQLFEQFRQWAGEGTALSLRIPIYAQAGINFYKKLGFRVYEPGEVDFIRLPSGKRITTIEMRQSQPDGSPVEEQLQPAEIAKPAPALSKTRKSARSNLIGRADLVQLSGQRASTIKYYTEIGILPFEQAEARLARRYQKEAALKRLEEIKAWRQQGLSITQIKQRLS